MRRFNYSLLVTLVLLTASCQNEADTTDIYFDYGTSNDSARYYFNKGWEEIMDNGRWTRSEEAFRKAIEFDPDWLLGQSLVGRITQDLEERERILNDIRENQEEANEDERLLLDVNLFSLEATNNMAKGKSNPPELLKLRQELAERNFGAFARKYPEDTYFKAEYIEFLNRNYGAQMALDSLRSLTTNDQRQLGFYISYEGLLELELGNIDQAIRLADELTPLMLDSTYLTQMVLESRILLELDSISFAQMIINKVVQTDPKHLIALGLKRRIDQAAITQVR